MKDYRQKLLSLLNICAENRDESKRLQYLSVILRSNDYTELRENAAFCAEFQRKFSVECLEKLDPPELNKRKNEITKIAKMFRLLQKAILFGNAHALTEEDIPDYRDIRTINKLLGKLTVGSERKNYSDIELSDCMTVFDDKTIKSSKVCFDLLPLSLAQNPEITDSDIKAALNGRHYCIDAEKFHAIHSNFLGFSSKAEETLKEEKLRRKKHRLFKVAVIMTIFGVLFLCSQFNLFTSADAEIVLLLLLLSSVVFIIWG